MSNLYISKNKLLRSFALRIIFTFLLVTFFSFLLMNISPIDPAEAYVRRNMQQADAETIEIIREQLGLNKPLLVQYFSWLSDIFRLDFGHSLVNGKDVFNQFTAVIPSTFTVVFIATILQLIGSVVLGSISYILRKSVLGKLLRIFLIIVISLPSFYIAEMYLNFFGMQLNIINIVSNDGFLKYLNPAICLSLPGTAFFARLIYVAIIREMAEEHNTYIRCCGISERVILLTRALPHVMLNLMPSLMQYIGFMVAGASMVEAVFSFAGVGSLMIHSILDRDAPMIHASVLLLACVFIASNFCSDLTSHLIQKQKGNTNESVQV